MAEQGGNPDASKIERKSNRLSSSEDEAAKEAVPSVSIDKRDGEQSGRSSKVNMSLSEQQKPGAGGS